MGSFFTTLGTTFDHCPQKTIEGLVEEQTLRMAVTAERPCCTVEHPWWVLSAASLNTENTSQKKVLLAALPGLVSCGKNLMGAWASKSLLLFPAVSHLKSFCMNLASPCPLATVAAAELLTVMEVVITELELLQTQWRKKEYLSYANL